MLINLPVMLILTDYASEGVRNIDNKKALSYNLSNNNN